MKRYETYKNSGVEWIGEIPEGWEVLKSKYLIKIKSGDALSSERIEPEGLFCVYGGGEKIGFYNKSNTKDTDILVGRVGARCGCVTYPKTEVWATDNALVLSTAENVDYLFYLLLGANLNRLNESIAQPLITGSKIGNMHIPLPPLSEQQQISSYLDYKVGQIDSSIAKIVEQIEDLKSYRQSVISEAVTKGLNPNAMMKDSGVDVIGIIPDNWKSMKTLYCLSMPITDGPHTTPTFYDEGIPFISAEAVSCGNGRIDFGHQRGYISQEFYEECCKKYIPQKDDIFMIKSGATTGKVAIVDTEKAFTIWSPLAVFRSNKDIILPKYLFFLLQSPLYQTQVQLGWSFGTQQNIGMRTLEKIVIPVPCVEEQEKILEFLDSKTSKIDSSIQALELQKSQLEDYKRSLISEAVTGKVDLRGWKTNKC